MLTAANREWTISNDQEEIDNLVVDKWVSSRNSC